MRKKSPHLAFYHKLHTINTNLYTEPMKKNSLLKTNRYLKDSNKAQQLKTRSIASSTAIETGESIEAIEHKINHLHSSEPRVTLA